MKRKSLLVLIAAEAAVLALVLGWAVYRAARRHHGPGGNRPAHYAAGNGACH